MKQVINTEKIPIKLWLDDLEESALQQAKNLANLPFLFRHVALMPDSHAGYGMPIGGVIAAQNVIIPNCVGVDIGCGMSFVETDIPVELFLKDDKELLKKAMEVVRRKIPVGFKKQKEPQNWIGFDEENEDITDFVESQFYNAKLSLGTLGGGNHFIEFQVNEKNNLCIMLHSGSRNLGKQIADYHNKIAKSLNERWYSSIDSSSQLAFLPLDSREGYAYLSDMNFALRFAKANRNLMIERVKNIIFNILEKYLGYTGLTIIQEQDVHHNYATMENHFGRNLMVHRKGATSARLDQIGIIPGSQGTKSYIVRGLGNKESFNSCSHGAGRRMSRTKARETLSLEEENKKLSNIVHNVRHQQDLDEAPGAYKPIDIVMKNQEDLVRIESELTPIGVIKG